MAEPREHTSHNWTVHSEMVQTVNFTIKKNLNAMLQIRNFQICQEIHPPPKDGWFHYQEFYKYLEKTKK